MPIHPSRLHGDAGFYLRMMQDRNTRLSQVQDLFFQTFLGHADPPDFGETLIRAYGPSILEDTAAMKPVLPQITRPGLLASAITGRCLSLYPLRPQAPNLLTGDARAWFIPVLERICELTPSVDSCSAFTLNSLASMNLTVTCAPGSASAVREPDTVTQTLSIHHTGQCQLTRILRDGNTRTSDIQIQPLMQAQLLAYALLFADADEESVPEGSTPASYTLTFQNLQGQTLKRCGVPGPGLSGERCEFSDMLRTYLSVPTLWGVDDFSQSIRSLVCARNIKMENGRVRHEQLFLNRSTSLMTWEVQLDHKPVLETSWHLGDLASHFLDALPQPFPNLIAPSANTLSESPDFEMHAVSVYGDRLDFQGIPEEVPHPQAFEAAFLLFRRLYPYLSVSTLQEPSLPDHGTLCLKVRLSTGRTGWFRADHELYDVGDEVLLPGDVKGIVLETDRPSTGARVRRPSVLGKC